MSPEQHFARFEAQYERCKTTWDFQGNVSAFSLNDDQTAKWQMVSKIEGQSVITDYQLFNWHMLMGEYHERSLSGRFVYGLPRYLSLFISKLPMDYFNSNWRYGLFFLYPLVLLIAFIHTAFWISFYTAMALDLSSIFATLVGTGLLTLLFLKFLGERWHFFLMLDDWAFAYDMMHSKNVKFIQKVEEFSLHLESLIDDSDADEILISAHSFGAIFAVSVLSKMLERKGGVEKPLIVLTAASSILKIAFSKQAKWLRDGLGRVLAQKNINWFEFFAINDPICFYKSKPDATLNIDAHNPIKAHRIRFQETISQERFKRISNNFFRIHRQIMLANDQRYFYDYFAYVSFPLPLGDWLTKEGRNKLSITGALQTLKEKQREEKAKGNS